MTLADIVDLRQDTLYIFRFGSARPTMCAVVLGYDDDPRNQMAPFIIVKEDGTGFVDALDLGNIVSIERA